MARSRYLVEYDTSAAFDGPASEVTVIASPFGSLELLLGGRDLMTGEEAVSLVSGVAYHVRVSAFNGIG